MAFPGSDDTAGRPTSRSPRVSIIHSAAFPQGDPMRWAARLYRQAVRTTRPLARRRPSRLRVESLEAREVPHVTGTAFLDLNLNGTQDAEDVGVPGVTVKATDAAGATETATTGTDGTFTLQTDVDDLRIEFSTLPEGTFAGRVAGTGGAV